jgi:hypothetical protein
VLGSLKVDSGKVGKPGYSDAIPGGKICGDHFANANGARKFSALDLMYLF